MNFNQPSQYQSASVHQWLEAGGAPLTIEMKTIQQSHSSAPEAVARVLVKQLAALFLTAARVPLNDPAGEGASVIVGKWQFQWTQSNPAAGLPGLASTWFTAES